LAESRWPETERFDWFRLFPAALFLPCKVMTVGVLQLELDISDSFSLKDKRRVVKSLKDRIAHGHNVSIAEVDALDEHRRSVLAVAMVGNDARYIEGALRKLVDYVSQNPYSSLSDYQIELL
jgi:uncharacterized protein YlxP (DUF503 family)